MSQVRIRVLAGCAAGALAIGSLIAAPALSQSASSAPQGKIEIKVLSSRYDLVSGGDALVEIKASEGAKASELKLSLNGRQLETPLKFDQPSNTLRGLVTGLDNGANWLQARGPSGYSVSQPLVNYPITGPILSGPHMKPFECKTKDPASARRWMTIARPRRSSSGSTSLPPAEPTRRWIARGRVPPTSP